MATAGYDYILSGLSWPNPSHITYSIAPDGVIWDHGTNNLNATFNGQFGSAWKREIARALATWESVANINITQVPESGNWDFGVAGPMQGDSRFGDIRFGGYNFDNNQTLAQTYSPPWASSVGGTGAGDVEVNTSMPWHIGSDYDFYSVMLHETGLALGLNEPPNPSVVMNTVYGGVRPGLTPGDIAGIQAIYGARGADVYQAHNQGVGFNTAIDVTPMLGTTHSAVVNNASLVVVGDTEYFSVVAPPGSGDTLQVVAAAGNISLLSPKVTLLDGSGNALASASNPSAWGDNVTATFTHVVPGQRYFIAVAGATSDVFAVGAYQLQVSFPHATVSSVSTPPPVYTPPPSHPTPTPTPFPQPTQTPSTPSFAWVYYRHRWYHILATRAIRLAHARQPLPIRILWR